MRRRRYNQPSSVNQSKARTIHLPDRTGESSVSDDEEDSDDDDDDDDEWTSDDRYHADDEYEEGEATASDDGDDPSSWPRSPTKYLRVVRNFPGQNSMSAVWFAFGIKRSQKNPQNFKCVFLQIATITIERDSEGKLITYCWVDEDNIDYPDPILVEFIQSFYKEFYHDFCRRTASSTNCPLKNILPMLVWTDGPDDRQEGSANNTKYNHGGVDVTAGAEDVFSTHHINNTMHMLLWTDGPDDQQEGNANNTKYSHGGVDVTAGAEDVFSTHHINNTMHMLLWTDGPDDQQEGSANNTKYSHGGVDVTAGAEDVFSTHPHQQHHAHASLDRWS